MRSKSAERIGISCREKDAGTGAGRVDSFGADIRRNTGLVQKGGGAHCHALRNVLRQVSSNGPAEHLLKWASFHSTQRL